MLGQSRPGLAPRAGAQGADSGSSLLPSRVRRSRPCHVSPAGRVGHSSPAPPPVGSPTEGTPPSPRLRNVRGAHGDHRGAENLRAPPHPAGAQAGPPPPRPRTTHHAETAKDRPAQASLAATTPHAVATHQARAPWLRLFPGGLHSANESARQSGDGWKAAPLRGAGCRRTAGSSSTSAGVVAAPTCTGVQAVVSTPPGTLHVRPEAGTGPAAPRPRPGLQPPLPPRPPPSTPGVPAPPPRPAPGAALRQKLLVQLSLTAPSVHCDSGTGEPGAPSHAALLQGCVHACAPALKLVTSHLGHGLWGPGARGGGGGAARLHPHQLTAR